VFPGHYINDRQLEIAEETGNSYIVEIPTVNSGLRVIRLKTVSAMAVFYRDKLGKSVSK